MLVQGSDSKMLGLYLKNQKLSMRKNLPIPRIEPGEALIKLNYAGICSTDLEMVKGYYPYQGILGHEFVGEVVEAPENSNWLGKRVVGEISIYCGTCESCLNGRKSHCENRRTLGIHAWDGVFAEYLKLPVENLWEVPKNVTDKQAVFTELLAAALEIQQQVHIKPTDRVIVVGAGRLGLLIAQCLSLIGCDLQVVVRRPEPEIMLRKWGIKAVFAEDLSLHKADIVVEVTGSEQGFALSRDLVRSKGVLVLKSTFAGNVTLNLSSVVVDEIQVIGSRCGPFGPALCLLEKNLVDVLSLISGTYNLSESIKAMQAATSPGALKILLKPDQAIPAI